MQMRRQSTGHFKLASYLLLGLFVLLVALSISGCIVETVPAGHVKVATLWGKVVEKPYGEGIHFPVNPFYSFTAFNCRDLSHKEVIAVPSQDQQQTRVELSVQYNLLADKTPWMLSTVGAAEDLIQVHLVPNLRSVAREEGKTIKRAEDFFQVETHQKLQTALMARLQPLMRERGCDITAILIRDVSLPQYITQAIEAKKVREQEAEKQQAELIRFTTEQKQKVAEAEAAAQAAELDAKKKRTLADAQAYEIEKVTQAMAKSPAYVQIKALETLSQIAKDPAAKLYFMDGNSPAPLPLMHLGDEKGRK